MRTAHESEQEPTENDKTDESHDSEEESTEEEYSFEVEAGEEADSGSGGETVDYSIYEPPTDEDSD